MDNCTIIEGSLKGSLMCNDLRLEGSLRIGGQSLPYYDGEYEVTPKITEQELKTANKSMTANVTIKSIPYYEASNPFGGTTITIG